MNIYNNLEEILNRRENMDKKFKKGVPEEVRVAIDTFFEHCKIMVEYELDNIPGEALYSLVNALATHPKYQNVCLSLIQMLNEDYPELNKLHI
tara:strand:+ start:164 stop:442 length:279 start_codon:yes stop_codon:yes gene_type:complete